MNEFFYNILTNFYDLGQLVRITRNHRGYINETYEIESFKDKKKCRWILRLYQKGVLEEKIKFEHALLLELAQRGFEISPRVILTKDNTTFLKVPKETKKGGAEAYISVYSCLPGKDKYSWDQPLCTDMELKNAAEILALYHSTIYEWKSEINWTEPRDIDKAPMMPAQLAGYVENAGTSVFDQYFSEHFDYLFKIFKKCKKKNVYNAMPHLAAHGDYHPGNLKFQNGKVSGVLDFDWSKMDMRSLDVGRGIYFFCTAWEGIADGKLLLERVDSFLEAYQSAAKELKGIGPLRRAELEYLPEMIHLSNLCVINWTLDEFYNTDRDPREYFIYLRHCVQCIQWMECNRGRLSRCVSNHEVR
ncbi:MAG: phosphotransferase [Candidatus Desulfatibia sp.]|uniref:phosphotransferase n=1 Tax=Candidatus Desulfatibia sp. TaxID=3101189 RepID=UPI002F339045